MCPYRDDNVHSLFGLDPDDRRWRADHSPYDGMRSGYPPEPRLRHLVLVDGRLVDAWAGPVEGTEWERFARREDEERGCRHVGIPAARHPYDLVLDWLDGLVGGRLALEGLTTGAWAPPARPTSWGPEEAAGYDAVAARFRRLSGPFRDDDVHVALLHALRLLWDRESGAITRAKSAAHVAGGLCWIVGRANGLFTPGGVTQKDLQRDLVLSSPLSSVGSQIHRSCRGLEPRPAARPSLGPSSGPDLLALGDPGLLTPATRRLIVSWRDRALAARDAHRADLTAAGSVPPPEVEP